MSKAESRIAALEKATAGRPRPLPVLFGLIEREGVESLTNEELEAVAGCVLDSELDGLIKVMTVTEIEKIAAGYSDDELEAILAGAKEQLRRAHERNQAAS